MPLDLAILLPSGHPGEAVPLGVEDHHQLMTLARTKQLKVLSKLDDYYEDVDLGLEDVRVALDELSIVSAAVGPSAFGDRIDAIVALFGRAVKENTGVSAIAD